MKWLDDIYANFWLSQEVDGTMSDGRYSMIIGEKVPGILGAVKKFAELFVPSFKIGQTYGDEGGRQITIVAIDDIDPATGNGAITFDLVNGNAGPTEANLWIAGIMTLAGLALTLFTVKEIRKLVPKDTINIALIVIGLVVIYAVYRLWKQK